ncbi:hypothetical protein GCM10008939_22780 [Deinococcus aquiradiocola]|uniref:Oligosaccharide repeat unit polymerase n=2 Tax=Deinococcus aquiradiocola TaxID=393059 RepID=A0A917PH05_9DEIO|nr:hypothetical protein GCM10008939_22780 [Deinococcus aquiradiocola]
MSYISVISSKVEFDWKKIIKIAAFVAIISISIFLAISVRRSMIDEAKSPLESIMYLIVGYFASAYNRLALVLSNSLVIPNQGTMYNSLLNILSPPFSNQFSFLKIGDLIGLSEPVVGTDAWIESFSSVSTTGLNPAFNWFTIFGIVYSDFGFYYPVYFLLYGILSGYAWKNYMQKSFLGIALYPWIVLSIFAWWGAENVYIAKRETVIIILIAVFHCALSVYIGIIRRK